MAPESEACTSRYNHHVTHDINQIKMVEMKYFISLCISRTIYHNSLRADKCIPLLISQFCLYKLSKKCHGGK